MLGLFVSWAWCLCLSTDKETDIRIFRSSSIHPFIYPFFLSSVNPSIKSISKHIIPSPSSHASKSPNPSSNRPYIRALFASLSSFHRSIIGVCLLSASPASPRHQFNDRLISDLQRRLRSFPERWTPSRFKTPLRELHSAFMSLRVAVDDYTMNWLVGSSPFNDSPSRIEALLFAEPEPNHSLNVNKDIRIFCNPHNYTPAEIKDHLGHDSRRRSEIATHLIVSIILPSVSLDGDPFKTLLPFRPATVCALDRLFTSIRNVDRKSLHLLDNLMKVMLILSAQYSTTLPTTSIGLLPRLRARNKARTKKTRRRCTERSLRPFLNLITLPIRPTRDLDVANSSKRFWTRLSSMD